MESDKRRESSNKSNIGNRESRRTQRSPSHLRVGVFSSSEAVGVNQNDGGVLSSFFSLQHHCASCLRGELSYRKSQPQGHKAHREHSEISEQGHYQNDPRINTK